MSDSDFLSLEQEVVLGAPLRLGDDAGVCDICGCDRRAEVIIPGAVLCDECAREFGVDVARVYRVPVDVLFDSSFAFMQARREQYASLLREYRERLLLPATPDREALVVELVREAVDELIRDAGGQP